MNAIRSIFFTLILFILPGCHIVWGGPAQTSPRWAQPAAPQAPRAVAVRPEVSDEFSDGLAAGAGSVRAPSPKPPREAPASGRAESEPLGLQFVLDTYLLNDVSLRGLPPKPSVQTLYRWACDQGAVYHNAAPSPGDLVFFHNTYDRNKNGRWDDWLTWVALVEAVRDDGTVSVIGYLDRRIVRLYLNTARPDHAVDAHGQTLNTLLRADEGPHNLVGSTARLFAGFADPIGPDQVASFRLNPRWQPNLLAHAPSQ